jgi:hypothetical protein
MGITEDTETEKNLFPNFVLSVSSVVKNSSPFIINPRR